MRLLHLPSPVPLALPLATCLLLVLPSLCHAYQSCGDETCQPSRRENCESCPTDCGACEPCGDGNCTFVETCSDCPDDCGVCPSCPEAGCALCGCPEGLYCEGSVCKPNVCVPSCPEGYCGPDQCGTQCACDNNMRCENETCVCLPTCGACGDDGCGGTCTDTCGLGTHCEGTICVPDCVPSCPEGYCGPDKAGCGTTCGCNEGSHCEAEVCVCTPTCGACGSDGCGGTCMDTCTAGTHCEGTSCVPDCTPSCPAGYCGPDQNGCDTTCGCDEGLQCVGTGCVLDCVPSCPEGYCGEDLAECGTTCSCSEDTQCNQTINACVPECEPTCPGEYCGPDLAGCGTTCGCTDGMHCESSTCLSDCVPSCPIGYCGPDLNGCNDICDCGEGMYCQESVCLSNPICPPPGTPSVICSPDTTVCPPPALAGFFPSLWHFLGSLIGFNPPQQIAQMEPLCCCPICNHDGTCDPDESAEKCPSDCGQTCAICVYATGEDVSAVWKERCDAWLAVQTDEKKFLKSNIDPLPDLSQCKSVNSMYIGHGRGCEQQLDTAYHVCTLCTGASDIRCTDLGCEGAADEAAADAEINDFQKKFQGVPGWKVDVTFSQSNTILTSDGRICRVVKKWTVTANKIDEEYGPCSPNGMCSPSGAVVKCKDPNTGAIREETCCESCGENISPNTISVWSDEGDACPVPHDSSGSCPVWSFVGVARGGCEKAKEHVLIDIANCFSEARKSCNYVEYGHFVPAYPAITFTNIGLGCMASALATYQCWNACLWPPSTPP